MVDITFAVTKTTLRNLKIQHKVLWFAQNSLPLRWQRQQASTNSWWTVCCDLLKIHYLCGDKDNTIWQHKQATLLWFAQNSLPLRWQRQPGGKDVYFSGCCDLLKIHYLCGDKDNQATHLCVNHRVVICSKFITFAVTKTTNCVQRDFLVCCDLLKIHYLCGDKDNSTFNCARTRTLWFAQNSLPLRWQRQLTVHFLQKAQCCDLLKIHYLCGDKDNPRFSYTAKRTVVICSKFITFAVTKTTNWLNLT